MQMRTLVISALLLLCVEAEAQITGIVLSKEAGKPLPGVTVSLLKDHKSTGIQTLAARDGSFILACPPVGSYELLITFIGYTAINIPLKISKSLNRVVLSPFELERKASKLSPIKMKP